MSKSCRGKPQSEPSFIVMLFDYMQVKWKVYLRPMKITFSHRKKKKKAIDFYFVIGLCRERGLQMNEGRVAVWHQRWYSHLLSFLLNAKFKPGWSEHCADKKQTARWLAHLPDTRLLLSSLVLGQYFFFNDRRWRRRAELHGSLLSSGCLRLLVFDVSQASTWARSRLLAPEHQPQMELSSEGEEGRKETHIQDRQDK